MPELQSRFVDVRRVRSTFADAWPKARDGRAIVPVENLLHWAFNVEFASVAEAARRPTGVGFPSAGAEVRISNALALGSERREGVRVDTSYGRSEPAEDAMVLAELVLREAGMPGALYVEDLARRSARPVWDLGPAVCSPVTWGRENQHGRVAKSEVAGRESYVSKAGRRIHFKVMITPVTYSPIAPERAAARRRWLEWHGILFGLQNTLKSVHLQRFVASDTLPPRTPWKKSS